MTPTKKKMGKAKINAENIEMARKKYYQYCNDKVITKIKLSKKKGDRQLYNEYDYMLHNRLIAVG